jgi:hypothetical protein
LRTFLAEFFRLRERSVLLAPNARSESEECAESLPKLKIPPPSFLFRSGVHLEPFGFRREDEGEKKPPNMPPPLRLDEELEDRLELFRTNAPLGE